MTAGRPDSHPLAAETDRSAVARHQPRQAARLGLACLPLLAALGPLASIHGGVYGFRIASATLIGIAVLSLMGREPWQTPDIWLALTTGVVVTAGLVGLPRIVPGSGNPYSEFLTLAVGLTAALASRAWQRHVPGLFLALSRGWVVAGLLICAIALVEVATGLHLPGYVVEAAPDPAATFGNPNSMAIFLVMAVVWVVPVYRTGNGWWRAATVLLTMVSAPLIYLANARLCLLVWAVAVAWAAVRGVHRSRHGLAGLALSAVPLGAAVIVLGAAPLLLGYATEIDTPGSSGGVREQLTREGLSFAAERGGLPTWPGSFEALMLTEGDLEESSGLINAHNAWVEVLVQYGLVSLVLLVGWLGACAVAGRSLPGGLSLAVGAFLVLGIVDSSSLDAPTTWAYVLTLAVASRTSSTAQAVVAHPGDQP